jgi:hypothetical protein
MWRSGKPLVHGFITLHNSGTTTPKLSLSLNSAHNSYVRWNATAGVQSREGEIRDTGNCTVSLPSRRAVAWPDEHSCSWKGIGPSRERRDTSTFDTKYIDTTIAVILYYAYFYLFNKFERMRSPPGLHMSRVSCSIPFQISVQFTKFQNILYDLFRAVSRPNIESFCFLQSAVSREVN